MSSNTQCNQEILQSIDHAINQLETEDDATEQIEQIDAALVDPSDSWETDDEGDFYSEQETHNWSDHDNNGDDSVLDFGLSEHLIKCYPTTTAESVSAVSIICDICLNEYKSDDILRIIPCLHRFHSKCIDKWLKKNSKCPVCRSDLRKSEWYSD